MEKKVKKLGASSEDWGVSLDGIIQKREPLPAVDDIRKLDFHNTGPHSVREFLDDDPYRIGKRATTRYATEAVMSRICGDEDIEQIQLAREEFVEAKKPLEQKYRKYYGDIIKGIKVGYRPFVSATNIHITFHDEVSLAATMDCLGKAELPHGLVFTFLADVFSTSSKIGDQLRADLKFEAYLGRAFLTHTLMVIEWAIKECKTVGVVGGVEKVRRSD